MQIATSRRYGRRARQASVICGNDALIEEAGNESGAARSPINEPRLRTGDLARCKQSPKARQGKEKLKGPTPFEHGHSGGGA